MKSIDQLKDLLDNDNIDVAIPDQTGRGRYDKVDKNVLKQQIDTKSKLSEIQGNLQNKNFDQRMIWLKEKKTEADQLYLKKQFKEALQQYLEALMGIVDKFENEQQRQELEYQIKYPILCNMSITCYEQGNYNKGLRFVQQAKKIKKNHRIYYITSLLEFKLQHYEKALQELKKALECGELSNEQTKINYQKFYNKIQNINTQTNKKEKVVYSKMFQKPLYKHKEIKMQESHQNGNQQNSEQSLTETLKKIPKNILQKNIGCCKKIWQFLRSFTKKEKLDQLTIFNKCL